MNGFDEKRYFLQPTESSQRRYEALRSAVVDEQPMKEIANRFGISYGTLRNWRCEFQQAVKAGIAPPFS
jgi:transposase-like protein